MTFFDSSNTVINPAYRTANLYSSHSVVVYPSSYKPRVDSDPSNHRDNNVQNSPKEDNFKDNLDEVQARDNKPVEDKKEVVDDRNPANDKPKADKKESTNISENNIEDTTNHNQDSSDSVFGVADMVKNEMVKAGISEEDLANISNADFINMMFALASGREVTSDNISTELLSSIESLSSEILDRLKSFFAGGARQDNIVNNAEQPIIVSDPVNTEDNIINPADLPSVNQHVNEVTNPLNYSDDNNPVNNSPVLSDANNPANHNIELANNTEEVSAQADDIVAVVNNNIKQNENNNNPANNPQSSTSNNTQANSTNNTQADPSKNNSDKPIVVESPVLGTESEDAAENLQSEISKNPANSQSPNNLAAQNNKFDNIVNQNTNPANSQVDINNPASHTLEVISQKSETVSAKSVNSSPAMAMNEAKSVPDQIKVSLARALGGGVNQATIQLDPMELGKVDIKLDWISGGKASVIVAVENPATLELLQKDARELAKALEQAGLNLSSGDLEFNLQQQGSQDNLSEFMRQMAEESYGRHLDPAFANDELYLESILAQLQNNDNVNIDEGVDVVV